MILEHRDGRDQTGLTTEDTEEHREIKSRPLQAALKTAADLAQLFSLLARFHEISSPMVELVLETGCL
jgi:hypothetical protein